MGDLQGIFDALGGVNSLTSALDFFIDAPMLLQAFLAATAVGLGFVFALIFKNLILSE